MMRRMGLAAAGLGIGLTLLTGPATAQPAEPAEHLPTPAAVADKGMRLFLDGLRTGDWQPFLDQTTPKFSFWFPEGPHAGRHEGIEGHRQLTEWAHGIADSGARVQGTVTGKYVDGNRVMYLTDGLGTEGPAIGYDNWEAIEITVRGNRISGLHEYWGDVTPTTTPAAERSPDRAITR